ncbi:uncharacterized protein LOC119309685 [Triticum dicoccoides]|uniref:uncharacterized protein LOC119309685 n=1 Tax=Triticum dicoccoides TaxID=85692 RepID=UPI001890FE5A|nr:uncharacterized protein LOC119309685 [Triticum dicoccoides]
MLRRTYVRTRLVVTQTRRICFVSRESLSRSCWAKNKLSRDSSWGASCSAWICSCRSPERQRRRRWTLVAHGAPCVLDGGGDAVPGSAAGSSDSAGGPVSPHVLQLDQGEGGLADGEFSGASCKTFVSGGGDVASGYATPAVVPHNSVQSSGRSGAADSCTTFSSGGLVLPSARVGDETPAVVSSCSVQSLSQSGPASANTTIRVGWKHRYTLIFLSPGANVYFPDRIHTSS